MTINSNLDIVKTPKELGELARAKRKAAGRSLVDTATAHNIGARFLSEFERGKATAEIGKVLTALHAVGIDLAIVSKQSTIETESSNNGLDKLPPVESATRLSKQLKLEFPYDWSNPHMDESVFIQRVLEKARFNDVLRVAHYFGIERVALESQQLRHLPQAQVIDKLLSRIRAGFAKAIIDS